LKQDATATGVSEATVEAAVTNSPALALLADLANLDKHGNLNRPPRSGHVPAIKTVKGSSVDSSSGGWRLDMEIEHAGHIIDGLQVANDATDAWRSVLRTWGLI